jgi:hypothetical protein
MRPAFTVSDIPGVCILSVRRCRARRANPRAVEGSLRGGTGTCDGRRLDEGIRRLCRPGQLYGRCVWNGPFDESGLDATRDHASPVLGSSRVDGI